MGEAVADAEKRVGVEEDVGRDSAGVRIETSCGTIDVDRGVNFENQEEVASSIEPGSEYDFDIGWYSRVVAKDILRGPPTADHYRPVNAP